MFYDFIDPSVVMINQIMYTFHRNELYVIENNKYESWYWSSSTFIQINPLLKYDYNNNLILMIASEIWNRIFQTFYFLFTFMVISNTNAMIIRIAIKCSVLSIFPMIFFQNIVQRGNANRQIHHTRLIYQSMGNTGAIAAYLDRNEKSKFELIFSIIIVLIIYYSMYVACFGLWTSLAFNNTYSGIVNNQYIFYSNSLELLTFIFVRTRSTIKYLPKLITIINLMFLMMINSHMYAAQYESLLLLN